MSSDSETPEEASEPKVYRGDDQRAVVEAQLKKALGNDVVGTELSGGDLWIRVNVTRWADAARACRDLGFDYFCFLSGIDWLPAPHMSGEKTFRGEGDVEDENEEVAVETVTGVTGGDSRFQVFARLYDTTRFIGVTLKADLNDAEPVAPTWINIYSGAAWHERETHEMYGFVFEGNGDLRNLYLPGAFEGYPLRKDFPLLARELKPWPGLVDVEPLPAGFEDAPSEGGD